MTVPTPSHPDTASTATPSAAAPVPAPRTATTRTGTDRGVPATGFSELGIPTVLVTALSGQGITVPFPIQVATLPDTLAGRDVLGRGRTGSGKTLAFGLPIVTRLVGGSRRPKRPRALVLVPTRELANQVLAVVRPLAEAVGLTSTVVYGGVGQNPQVKALAPGVDVLIACPGRLEDLLGQGACDLSGVEITVLDEADHMADLGFLPAVKRLLDRTPKVGQRMLFSATLDNGVDVLVKRYLHQPSTHSVDPAVSPVSTMTHHVFAVSSADKQSVVHELASGQERSLLFMRTKHTAKKLAKQLTAAGIPAVELHGNLSQGAGAQPVRIHRGQHAGARRDRHRGAGHPCRRHRARRARRSPDRAQGLPAPIGPYRAGRRRWNGRHHRHARPELGGADPGQAGGHPPHDRLGTAG